MTTVLHAALAVGGTFVLWRAALRVAQGAPDDAVAAAFPMAVLIATAFGSLAALAAGREKAAAMAPGSEEVAGTAPAHPTRPRSAARMLALDAATLGGAAWWLFVLTLAPWTRELGGVSLVLIAAARLAPGALAVATLRAPSWLAFVVALGGYGALAAWLPAASLPFGDQVHYLLAAEQLRLGSLEAGGGAELFRSLVGFAPGPADVATHVADTPLGPRPIQGYALQLLLLPGWAVAGRLGAHLTMAAVAAWASWQTFLILRDLHRGAHFDTRREGSGGGAQLDPSLEGQREGLSASSLLPAAVAGWTWVLASFTAPMALLATHLYPNMLGAALIATAFRAGFTAPVRRPALAAGVLALTLFLTPRDGVALLVLLPFLLWPGARRAAGSLVSRLRRPDRSVVIATGVVALVAVVLNAALYGLPLPYAGYAFGTAQAQALTQEPSITPRFWIGLPAILFDRTLGLAGSAPWAFVGLLGLVPLLRLEQGLRRHDPEARAVLLPAALTVGLSVLALSFFRLWEGGYAPPNRYFVDVLPLWTPFVAAGLVLASGRLRVERAGRLVKVTPGAVVRALVAVLLFASALMTVVLAGVPMTALNTAFDHQFRDAMARILGLDPLAWLPSFQPVRPDWYVVAYLRLVPALAFAAGLVLLGAALSGRVGRGAGVLEAPRVAGSMDVGDGVDADHPAPEAVTSPRPTSPAETGRAQLARFAAANAVALALVVAAVALRPVAGAETAPVPTSLMGTWLPFALVLATLGAVVVWRGIWPPGGAGGVKETAAARLLDRHFLVYLVPLSLMLVGYAGGGMLANAQLGAVYLAVAVVFAVNTLAALWPRIGALSDRAAALQVGAVALVVFLVLLPYHKAVMPTASDEPHYLLIVQSLIYDGDVDLRNDYEGDRYSAFYPARLPDMHGIEIGSAVYPIRDLGLPLLGAVPFALAGRLGVLALMCLAGAALAAQLYLLLRDLRFDPRVAFLAVATTALAHPILTYTTQVYPELLTALVFVTVARLVRAGARATPRELALASLLVGLLPVLSTRAWPIAVGLGLVVAYAALRPWWDARRSGGLQNLARVAAGALPFAAVIAALSLANWLMFGVFLPSAGYYIIREQQQVLAYAPHVGGTGLVLDRVFGIVPRAPVYLLGLLGVFALLRRARGHGVELPALALGGLLSFAYISNIAYWWADGSPPSRYLLGAIPLFVA
ncbi:MAG: hypothetical protein ACRDGT_11135, partial [Candidatus Limnocylindria bacterium]